MPLVMGSQNGGPLRSGGIAEATAFGGRERKDGQFAGGFSGNRRWAEPSCRALEDGLFTCRAASSGPGGAGTRGGDEHVFQVVVSE